MKRRGPIITLAVGLVLAAVLLVVDLNVTHRRDAANAAADAAAANAAAAAPVAATTKAAAAPTPAPTKSQPPAVGTQTTYAGKIGDGGATLAIAVKDGKAVAYVCDGHTAEAWLQGTVVDGALALAGTRNASLTGTIVSGVASGKVLAAGRQWQFSISTVAPPSGLYRSAANVRGAQVVGGWIVLENGQQVGMVDFGDHEETAPALTGTTANIGGTTVTATQLDGSGL